MSEKKRPVLSISMLVSNNRRDTIEKCMESLVPLRKAVPSELIIVDTGCTDGSVDIAGKYADKVIEFPWCNDFSAARNAGLSECTGKWFLYLDDDEWFEDVTELIAFFLGEEQKYCDALWYLQRNYDDFEGTSYVDTYVGRVVKRTPDTRFCGKIHEWLEPLPKMIKKANAYVHHYGYVYKNEEERKKHLLRNLTLEEAAVKEHPEDIRMCSQLVQEYRAAERYEDAKALCLATLKNTKYAVTNSFVQYLLSALPRIYCEQGEYEKALAEYERLERENPLLHQTRLVLFCEKTLIYGKLEREAELQRECRRYLEEYDAPPKAGEPAEFPIMDFAYYQSPACRQKVVRAGIMGALRSKDYAQAEALFDAADWEGDKKNASDLLLALLQCYLGSGNAVFFTGYLPRALRVDGLDAQVYAALHSVYEKYPEKRERFVTDLEALGLRDGNFAFFHLVFTEGKGITTLRDLEDYYRKSDRRYDAEVVALLSGNAGLFRTVLEQTSVELYAEAVSLLTAERDGAALEALRQSLYTCKEQYPEEKKSFLFYADMVIAEKQLALAAEEAVCGRTTKGDGSTAEGESADTADGRKAETAAKCSRRVRTLLEAYIGTVKQYCEGIYCPELLTAFGAAALPANIRFAYIMEEAMTAEEDMSVWGDGIKRAAKEYPVLLPVVRVLLDEKKATARGVPKRQPEASLSKNSAQQELLALAKQLKAMVRKQLAEGKTEEAGAILSELAVMLPKDEEVKELLGV